MTAEGAARETWEEANCQVEIMAPYSHFDIPVIGQAYILFRYVLQCLQLMRPSLVCDTCITSHLVHVYALHHNSVIRVVHLMHCIRCGSVTVNMICACYVDSLHR